MRLFLSRFLSLGLLVPLLISCRSQSRSPDEAVGPTPRGMVVPTRQLIRPAGQTLTHPGRPVDLVVSPDGHTAYVKSNTSLLVIDIPAWRVIQELKYPPKHGASLHGLALTRDGQRLYITLGPSTLQEVLIGTDRQCRLGRTLSLAAKDSKRASYPCGLALSADDQRAYVCQNLSNTLAVVDLQAGTILSEIPVGMAPYDVCLSPDGHEAYVSNWGGRRPRPGDQTARSGGSEIVINEHSASATGTVSILNLTPLLPRPVAAAANPSIPPVEVAVGLHPADVLLSGDGKTLYIANANSDTVSLLDTAAQRVTQTLNVRPDANLLFGSASNALALSADGKTLFVANGGNNAVAVVSLNGPAAVRGFIPAGWYPGALAVANNQLLIANVKGVGSRHPEKPGKWNSKFFLGSLSRVDLPDAGTLQRYTKQVRADALVPQALSARERARPDMPARPIPQRIGEPSPIEHVVYIIKENRTYDQVFGDLTQANHDSSLCIFGRQVTPNQHALAERFVLLDNYYCNGVLSADGHAWSTQGIAVDYLEKTFGVWMRSYPFSSEDPMAIAPTGFLWDDVLLHGLSFRNYGETARTSTGGRAADYYAPAVVNAAHPRTHFPGPLAWHNTLGPEAIAPYTHPTYPGWNLNIPDVVRAQIFLDEFERMKAQGKFPNLTIIYLPQDHTHGTSPGTPTPAAMVADNDLAVGRIVEALSHSSFWPTMAIFVIEDDPQAGFDHVDGHRSTCLVISPYAKRRQVISHFYNQTSVLRTMELILGLPPMNQMDALSPSLADCFTTSPNLTAFTALPNEIPLDQVNPPKSALSGTALRLANLSERQNFAEPDRADENALNRIVWHAQKGAAAPYPADWAGAHGRGLKALHLHLDGAVHDDDD